MANKTIDTLDLTPPDEYADLQIWLARNLGIIAALLEEGNAVTDTFTTTDGKTVTVENGIVKGIV